VVRFFSFSRRRTLLSSCLRLERLGQRRRGMLASLCFWGVGGVVLCGMARGGMESCC
jgi:hypothetical protein